jgi:hypothetical protein
VDFEDDLSISNLKNKAPFSKNCPTGNQKVSKGQKCSNARPPTFISNSSCEGFPEDWSILKRAKSWRWFQAGFLDWMRS